MRLWGWGVQPYRIGGVHDVGLRILSREVVRVVNKCHGGVAVVKVQVVMSTLRDYS